MDERCAFLGLVLDLLEQLCDDVIACNKVSLGFKVDEDAVPEGGMRHGGDVMEGDVVSAGDERLDLGCEDEGLCAAWRDADADVST